MYEKGRSFIMAGGLVKAYEGHQFVYLHLLCQGFENIGKAMLLIKNYDKYGPLLKRYGHDLESLLEELVQLYDINFLSREAVEELILLNRFYKLHQFRYGDKIDSSENFSSLRADKLHSELVELLNTLNQKFATIEKDIN